MIRSNMCVLLLEVLVAFNLQFFLFGQVNALTVRIPKGGSGNGKSLHQIRVTPIPVPFPSHDRNLNVMITLPLSFLSSSSSLFSPATRRQSMSAHQRPYLSSSSSSPCCMMMYPTHRNDILSFSNNIHSNYDNFMDMNMINDFNNLLLSFVSSLSPNFSSLKLSLLLPFVSGSGMTVSIIAIVYYYILVHSMQDFQKLDGRTKRHLFMAQDASMVGIVQTLRRVKKMNEKEEEKKDLRQNFVVKMMVEAENNNNCNEIPDHKGMLKNNDEGIVGKEKNENNKKMRKLKQDDDDDCNILNKIGLFWESLSRNVTGSFDFGSSSDSSTASTYNTDSLTISDEKEELMLQLQLLEEENSLLEKLINNTMNNDDDAQDDDDYNEQDHNEIDYDSNLEEDLKSLSQEELEQQIKQLQQDIIELNKKREEKLKGVNNATQEILNDITLEVKSNYDDRITSVTNTSVKEEVGLKATEVTEGMGVMNEGNSKTFVLSPLTKKNESQTDVESGKIQIEISSKSISNDSRNEGGKKDTKDSVNTLDKFQFIEEQLVAKKGLTISKQLNDLGISKTSKNLTSTMSQNERDESFMLQEGNSSVIGSIDTTKSILGDGKILNMSALSQEENDENKLGPSSQARESQSKPLIEIKLSEKGSVANLKKYHGDSNRDDSNNKLFSSKDRKKITSETVCMNQVKLSDEFETSSLSNASEAQNEEPKEQSSPKNQNKILPSLPNTGIKDVDLIDESLKEKVEHAKEAIAEVMKGTNYQQSSLKTEDNQSENEDVSIHIGAKLSPGEDSTEFLISEREKRQKAMAQDLATAAFHEELQRNKRKNKDDEIRTQYYKNQIESDMARVRKYAAQKRLRKEVKLASDMHSNSNLLSIRSNEKTVTVIKDKVSLQRQVKSSTSLKSTALAAGEGETHKDIKNNITLWDIINKESEMKQGKRFSLPLNERESNGRGILLLGKSKRFKTPKRTSENHVASLSSENKENRTLVSNSVLRKRSLAIALTLVVVKRISQWILL